MWLEAVLGNLQVLSQKLFRSTKNRLRLCWCVGRISNRSPPEQRSEAIQLKPSCPLRGKKNRSYPPSRTYSVTMIWHKSFPTEIPQVANFHTSIFIIFRHTFLPYQELRSILSDIYSMENLIVNEEEFFAFETNLRKKWLKMGYGLNWQNICFNFWCLWMR